MYQGLGGRKEFITRQERAPEKTAVIVAKKNYIQRGGDSGTKQKILAYILYIPARKV